MKHLTVLAVLMAGPSLAESVDVTTVHYICDHGARVDATYINVGEASFAVVSFEGRQLGFAIGPAASGARYASTDPAQPFIWWTKGQAASLWAGPEGNDVAIYQDCVEAK